MGYSDIIAQKHDVYNPDKYNQVIDYIVYIKTRQSTADSSLPSSAPKKISTFFRDFNVNTSGYKLDREDANAR